MIPRRRGHDGRLGYRQGFESGVLMTLKDIECGRSVEDLREELPRLLDTMRVADDLLISAAEGDAP